MDISHTNRKGLGAMFDDEFIKRMEKKKQEYIARKQAALNPDQKQQKTEEGEEALEP